MKTFSTVTLQDFLSPIIVLFSFPYPIFRCDFSHDTSQCVDGSSHVEGVGIQVCWYGMELHEVAGKVYVSESSVIQLAIGIKKNNYFLGGPYLPL